MNYKQFGYTAEKVSALCLGTMNFGQQCTEVQGHEQLDYAISRGINIIDTAEVYPIPPDKSKQGMTETIVGNWLKKSGKRTEVFLASKVSARGMAGVVGTRDAAAGLTRASITQAIDGTLARLQTNHLDLYQVHFPDRHMNNNGVRGVQFLDGDDGATIEETLAVLDGLVKSGKIKYVGVSNENPWGLGEYLRVSREKGYARVASIQNQYSLTNRTFEIGLSEMCMRENVACLPYSVLNMGVLTGKYLDGAQPEGARFTGTGRNRPRYNPDHAYPQNAFRTYVELEKSFGLKPGQLPIMFAQSRPFNTSVILGATSIEQLKSNIDAGDIPFTDDMMNAISETYRVMPDPTC